MMMHLFWPRLRGGERGQAMIFTAVVMSALMGTMGIAVEGGRVFVEYRQLQSAADMAALVGAQDLPCTTTNTSCITTAETLGCTYATNNGYSGCSAGGTSGQWADVPPLSCSPYDFIDYGNGNTNANCKSASAPIAYDYIEVKLSKNLGSIPIFNIPVTLSAHAVAKHGPITGGDYAVIELDPNSPLNIGGNGKIEVIGSVFGNGGVSGNGKTPATCAGGWFGAGPVSGVNTDLIGTPTYAPPGCSGSNDTMPDTNGNFAQLTDPYSTSSAPPVSGGFTNCSECMAQGWWYSLDSGTWNQGGTPSGDAELFPGIYSGLSPGKSSYMYFNPGVYEFTNGIDVNHGRMCVYGSPSCGDDSCASTPFSPGSSAGNQWYYSCSPYGFWDSSTFGGTRPSSLPTTAPYFYDPSGVNTTTPLNGVTFYMPAGSGGFTSHGEGGKYGGNYLAAPNPCSGTGTFASGNPGSVSYPAGAASGVYTYTSSYTSTNFGLPHGVTQSPTTTAVYPNNDFTVAGDCGSDLEVWPGEMPVPHHLHFLFYILDSSGMKMNGTGSQLFTGIFYAPQDSITMNGNHNSSSGTPPFLTGQLIGYDLSFSGNSTTDVYYRNCGPSSSPCGAGDGTQLIE